MQEEFELNEDQKRITRCLEKFMARDPSTNFRKNCVLLFGAGGVGKTTTVRRFCIKNFQRDEVALACPTHKAAEVLRTGMKGFDVVTIHRFLGLQFVYDKEGNGKMERVTELENTKYVKLLVVDECSMIERKLLDYIGDWSRHHMAKVLFLGDKHQLPPVGSSSSPVFDLVSPNNKLSLTKNMRASDNSISFAHKLFREAVDSHKIEYPDSWQINSENPDASVFIVPNREYLISEFVQKDSNEDESTVILAWRNRVVFEYNCAIRLELFGERSRKNPYLQGEKMMFHSYFISGGHDKKTKNGVKYTTCERTTVLSVETGRYDHPWFYDGLWAYKLLIKSPKASGGVDIIYIVQKKDKKMYDERCKEMKRVYKAAHMGLDPSEVLPDQEGKEQDEEDRKKKEWKEFYRIADSFAPPISYSYSSSTHRAQGSSYTNVFVDLGDILSNWTKSDAFRCAYTAVSRSSAKLYIIQ
ncbi:ATP-dependent exoDNAse alpha subunit [Brazilian marseillevirus]|uniref:ATP-dependent exoDNAse alpha subunit n=1 Tax=Brazilian marseillevirus TaxID=1813599 RepID=UPI000783457C|nr:ATP-dependent exoDNAse alpha subunit [Brazilian marseillevirus]AMQ10951.1 ATP-dependent exoDNAse alpha subunit [Brazilian marseillevirus]